MDAFLATFGERLENNESKLRSSVVTAGRLSRSESLVHVSSSLTDAAHFRRLIFPTLHKTGI